MARKIRQRISYVLPLANATAGHRLGVNGIAFDRGSSILYTAGRDGQIYAWDTDTQSSSPSRNSQISPPGKTKAAAKYRQHVQAHSHWINDIVLVHDNSALVSASSDNSVKLWRPHAEDVIAPQTIGFHNDYVKTLASPGRHAPWLASGGLDHKIYLWDLERGGRKLQIQNSDEEFPDKGSVYALCANESLIANGGPESVVKVWDIRSGKRVTQFVGHTDNIRDVLISQDSETILTASSDQTVKVWSMTAGRCLHTLTMHNDSVWCLYSDLPQLSVFYSGDRAGFVAKTDTRGVLDVDDGLSIALCQEKHGVNKIVSTGTTFWTATASASVNRWSDIDMSAGLQIPDSMSNYIWQNSTRSRISTSSKLESQLQQTGAQAPKVPLNCVLRISNTSKWPPLQLRNRQDRSLSQQTANARKGSVAVFESEIGAFEPLRSTPDGFIQGQNGLIRHILLNDRRRVLTLDTAGEVMMWDLLQCTPTKSFGKRLIEDVVPEVNTIGTIAHWCTVDTRTGLLTCVLEENHCFDAEVYADELKEAEYMAFREDQRINLGKWVLRYLFASLLDEEIRRDEFYRSTLKAARNGRASTRNLNRPTSIQLPQNEFNGGWSESTAPTPRPMNGGYLNLKTPGLAIGLATPGGPLMSPSLSHLAQPMSPNGMHSDNGQNWRQSLDKAADYFSSKPTSRSQSPAPTTPGSAMSPRIPATPSDSTFDPGPLSPSLDKGKETGFKKFRLSFAGKKLTRAPTAEHTNKPAVPNVTEDDTESNSSKTEEFVFDDSFYGCIQRIRSEYTVSENDLLGPLETMVLPGLPNELPVLKPPLNTTIIIQEEPSDSAGIQDLYVGRIGDLADSADKIEKLAPIWLGDALLRNRIPSKEIAKVSFTLEPFKKELPIVTSNDGSERLNANRMLRARKILAYVAERLEPHKQHADPSQPSPDAMRPEDYLELYCHNELVPTKMTLATIRTHLWKGGGDVALFYRANGKKRISLPPATTSTSTSTTTATSTTTTTSPATAISTSTSTNAAANAATPSTTTSTQARGARTPMSLLAGSGVGLGMGMGMGMGLGRRSAENGGGVAGGSGSGGGGGGGSGSGGTVYRSGGVV